MFGFKHVSGILMVRDQEMISFQLDHERIDFQEITPVADLEWKPFDFWDGYSRASIQGFLEDHLTCSKSILPAQWLTSMPCKELL